MKPDPWTARVLPFQLLQLGDLAVIALPFEITTVAGHRLKEIVRQKLGIKYVALTSLANEYAHYVTTPEEYAMQGYEGGSNLFGPNSLSAYEEILSGLADHLQRGEQPVSQAKPLDLSRKQVRLRPGVFFDTAPSGKVFGSVYEEPSPSYDRGNLVKLTFWGAHPNNAVGLIKSYLSVERESEGGAFIPLRYDWDPDTKMTWHRSGLSQSKVDIEWRIGSDIPQGRYRICHAGAAKALMSRAVTPYQGCSRPFQVH
jgi:neutral ceramidase